MSVGGSSRLEYEQRVNRVIDHVGDHLADDLSLERLARIAAFSPFHFHRVFRGVTGETLFGFIQRLRVERAATALRDHPDESVLAIALDHGFASAATFARAFKAYFGMSATAWRKPGKANRKRGKASRTGTRDRRRMHVRIMRAHELLGPRSIRLGIARDDPEVTAPEKLRYDACVVVPDDFVADRRVNVAELAAGRYAVGEFAGTAHDIVGAWETLYRSWLPGSGYQPDDRPCVELYRGETHVAGKPDTFRCELCVPIRPL